MKEIFLKQQLINSKINHKKDHKVNKNQEQSLGEALVVQKKRKKIGQKHQKEQDQKLCNRKRS